MSEAVEARANRIKLAKELCRLDPECMEDHNLNLAMALILKKDIMVRKTDVLLKSPNGEMTYYTPMENATQLLEVMSNVTVNVGTHALYGDEDDSESVIGHWYSADCQLSGTSYNSTNSIAEAVGTAIAKLLKSMMSWSNDWKE